MVRKAKITILLVDESSQKTKKELEEEISQALSKFRFIPWEAEIEKVEVIEV